MRRAWETYVAGNFTSKLCLMAAAISCSVFFSCIATIAHWMAYSCSSGVIIDCLMTGGFDDMVKELRRSTLRLLLRCLLRLLGRPVWTRVKGRTDRDLAGPSAPFDETEGDYERKMG